LGVWQSQWVKKMTFEQFQSRVDLSGQGICRQVLARNRQAIQVKKEQTALKNLEKIFAAVLKISSTKGFTAMTMRDLSRETGMSAGAMYAYFASKEELLEMMQQHRRTLVSQILDRHVDPQDAPAAQMAALIRTHLYLSEMMQPWFYFSYMEAKNFSKPQRDAAVAASRFTENRLAELIRHGQQAGAFAPCDPQLAAGLIQAMLQDWYLKHAKHTRRGVSVDRYADFVLAVVEGFLLPERLGRGLALEPAETRINPASPPRQSRPF